MPYVYKYINNETGLVDYVGKVGDGDNLDARISAHKRDSWFISHSYRIEYMYFESAGEADAVETHFINKYKSTYNVAKVGWGTLGFINEELFKWKEYSSNYSNKESVHERITLLRRQLWEYQSKIEQIERELDKIDNYFDRELFESVVDWMNNRTEFVCGIIPAAREGICITKDDAYNDYWNYTGEKDICCFNNIDEFWACIGRRRFALYGAVTENELLGYQLVALEDNNGKRTSKNEPTGNRNYDISQY